MNKKRISILITAIVSTFILRGTYISSVNNSKKISSYETLKGSLNSLGDSKLLLNAYSVFNDEQIGISKDGISKISSFNSNLQYYYNAFSREFINENKDFFKKMTYGEVLIGEDTLTSIDLEREWENNTSKYYLDINFKNGKEKTESFELELKEFVGKSDCRILDIVNSGENILVAAYFGDYTADSNVGKVCLISINTKNKSYEIISNDILNIDENYNIEAYELILTEKYLYANRFDEDGKKIIIKKDITSDDIYEVIYKDEKEANNIKFETSHKSSNKKELYTLTTTTDGKLKLDVLDGKTGKFKSYADLNTNKLNYNTTKDYSLSIDKCILDGNNLIISGRAQTTDTVEESFIEIIDLTTKESVYVAKLPINASVYEYIK